MSQMRRGLRTRQRISKSSHVHSLEVVSDSPLWRRLNGSAFQVRGQAAAKDRSTGTWNMARRIASEQ